MLEPADLDRAAGLCVETLQPLQEADWDLPAGDLNWSCRRTLDHIWDALLFYATHLATESPQRRYAVRNTDPDASVPQLLQAVEASAAILARLAEAASPAARAFHPAGMADPSGFVAMGCDEILVHTGDIAAGVGADFAPPAQLCQAVLDRLFPWAPAGDDPWATLRWANGRAALGERPRQGPDWYWHCAPLEEWDGQPKFRTAPPAWT